MPVDDASGSSTPALRELEWLRALAIHSPAPTVIVTVEGFVWFINDRAAAFAGTGADEVRGRLLWEAFPAATMEAWQRFYAAVSVAGTMTRAIMWPGTDGILQPMQLEATLIGSAAPRPMLVSAAFVPGGTSTGAPDTGTDRPGPSFLDQPFVGVAIVDESGSWVDVNRRMTEIARRSEQELRSMNALQLLYPGDRERVTAAAAEAVGRPGPLTLDLRLVGPDGTPRWVQMSAAFQTVDGRVRATVVVTDTDELHRARDAHAERQALFAAAVAGGTDGWLMLRAGRIVEANRTARVMLGFDDRDVVGLTAAELGFPRVPLTDPSTDEADPAVVTWHYRLPDGRVTAFDASLVPVRGATERVVHVLLRDAAERLRVTAGLDRTTRMLAALSATNRALTSEMDDVTFAEHICDTVARAFDFRLAWIAGVDEGGSLRVKAVRGPAVGFLDVVMSAGIDDALRNGATGIALRTGAVTRLRVADLVPPPTWADEARRAGVGAAACFPLRVAGRTAGVLTVYAGSVDDLDDHLMEILGEIAGDTASAMKRHHDRVRLSRAEVERDLTTERASRRERALDHLLAGLSAQSGRAYFDGLAGALAQATDAMAVRVARYEENADGRWFVMLSVVGGQTSAQGERIAVDEVPSMRAVLEEGLVVVSSLASLRFSADAALEHVGEGFAGMRLEHAGRPVGVLCAHFPRPIIETAWVERAMRAFVMRAAAELARESGEQRIRAALVSAVETLGRMIDARDPYTAGHQRRVAAVGVALARELGLDDERIEGLRLGALIHDIGKLRVPLDILTRPGRLGAAEFEVVKAHTTIGRDIVARMDFPWPIADMIHQHHERWDGQGYPQKLRETDICLEARILAVADVVEAMAAHRPYRAALGITEALNHVERCRGTAFDPEIADACLRLFRERGFVMPSEREMG